MKTSETTEKVLPALLKASSQFSPVLFDAQNTHFKSKYATLPAYLDAVQPALRGAGLLLTQATHVADGVTVVNTRVTHAESGQWVGSEYHVHPVKADPQAEGSALTYARRYALAALLGLAADDDDGNAASKGKQSPAPTPIRANPMDGVEVNDEHRSIAATVIEYADQEDWKGGMSYLSRQTLPADDKAAVWSLLPSNVRTKLKKAQEAA